MPVLAIGGMLGLGYLAMRSAGKNQANAQQSALVDLQNANNTALDNLPQVPTAPDATGADENSPTEQARQAQLVALAQAEQRNATNPTGGQGLLGMPNTNKKTLLGF
jgi:hypothetical protein